MAKKKKEPWRPTSIDDVDRKEKENKLDPDRPIFFLYICMPLGAAAGLGLGVVARNVFIGVTFGLVVGILIGNKLDARFPRKRK